ncbi:hypothetical protein SCP_0402750 [Sparassis crispa]|uniref:Uncharacterized protein n=1 Tax=Sparassis crispa TaxID=139825 RepID=A0A401GIF9_9APHY|nr:hypothetical protein SCP_0402750 [Sparassis crispa]GBE81901.1 hypothetical protein SCP_0402750 [Sparassis crispa]
MDFFKVSSTVPYNMKLQCNSHSIDPPSLPWCLLKNGMSPVHTLAVVLLLVSVLTAILCSLSSRDSDILLARRRQALYAILFLVTPTCSLWSAAYLAIARRAAASGNNIVRLPLRELLDDIVAGKMQLRDTGLDLPSLITSTLRVHDWLIVLRVELSWWATVLGWIAASHFSFIKSYSFVWSGSQFISDRKTSPSSSSFKTSSLTQTLHNLNGTRTEAVSLLPARGLSLDTVPYLHLEAFVRALQTALCPGSCISINFTARCTSVSFLSSSFVLTALPFLPRQRIHRGSRNTYTSQQLSSTSSDAVRTTTPLFASLSYVLDLITSGSMPLIVHSVRNVSEQQASSLNAYVRDLEEDAGVRMAFVRRWGLPGWREEMVYTSWEAALLTSRLLERWEVMAYKAV